jgi:hypothetical protein
MGEQYALRFDQLQRILGEQAQAPTDQTNFLSDSATRHAINRWKQSGLVESKKILADMPVWVWPTNAGLRTVDLDFKKYEPTPTTLRHLYWITQVRLYLKKRYHDAIWTPERYLRANTTDETSHLPDGEIRLNGETIPIEVELTAKSAIRLRHILDDLLITYRGPVWYFVHKDSYQALATAWKQLNEAQRQRISVSKLESFTE